MHAKISGLDGAGRQVAGPTFENGATLEQTMHAVGHAKRLRDVLLDDEDAGPFGDDLREIYQQCGYVLIDLPCLPVQERADFILHSL